MGLVDEGDELLGKVVDEDARPRARLPARERGGVVLDAGAVAHLLEHLEVVLGAALEPLGLDELIGGHQAPVALVELGAYPRDRVLDLVLGHHEVLGRVDDRLVELGPGRARDGVELAYPRHLVVVELDPVGLLEVGRVDLEDVAADPEAPALEDGIVALVLQGDELALHLLQVDLGAFIDVEAHFLVEVGRAQAVDAGDSRHDDDVAPFHERGGGREAHAVDLLVDVRVLLDIQVLRRDVCLWLVVVVIGDEVLDRVVREEGLELAVELGREGLVVRDDEGGTLYGLDDLGHRVGLARAGDALEGLPFEAFLDAASEQLDSLGLVSGGLVRGVYSERSHSGSLALLLS